MTVATPTAAVGIEIERALRERRIVVEAVVRGTQATCYVGRFDRSGERVVFKHFERVMSRTNGEQCDVEFQALHDLARALTEVPDVVSPEPLELVREAPGILMTYVDGERLRSHVRVSPHELVAQRLVAGLDAYHGVAARIHGDFHAGNVLVNASGSTGLLDPGAANASYEDLAAGRPLLARDLGYWCYVIAATAHRSPTRAMRLLPLTRRLVEAAAERLGVPFHELAADVRDTAAEYVELLPPSRLPHGAMLRVSARTGLRAIGAALSRTPRPGQVVA